MITVFENFLNENVDKNLLLDELKGANFIYVEYISKDNGWGVSYLKNDVRKYMGGFDFNEDVHEFLIEHGIDYDGKNGYLYMKKYRANMKKIPFQDYQKDLVMNGIGDILED